MTLGEKIRKYRKIKGMTQKELGLAVGFTESTADLRIRKYERNEIAPKADIRKKLADVLDVEISRLNNNDLSIDIIDSLDQLFELLNFDVEYTDNRIALILPEYYEDDEFKNKLYTWAEYTRCLKNVKDAEKKLERLRKKKDSLSHL